MILLEPAYKILHATGEVQAADHLSNTVFLESAKPSQATYIHIHFAAACLLVWRISSQFVTIETSFPPAIDDDI